GHKATPTTASQRSTAKTKSGPQKPTATTGPRTIPPAPPRGRTELYKVGDAPIDAGAKPPSPNSGHTVIVDALQPAAPFQPPVEEPPPSKRGAKAGRKRPPVEQAPTAEPDADNESARKRRVAFGEHVLNRLR
ncbi:MAG TPA: hypothetical protein VFG69_10590, partial [Nannocystaceae bacterium]|nr:hypothetical protein [Nannocystaceae bacterium]